MDIRELRYFLAVAREGTITKAAEYLFITQPSLTRLLQKMEEEIGAQLFIRGSRKLTLTDTGALLRCRAEEIVALYDKTKTELVRPTEEICGDIHIGGGESAAIRTVAEVAKEVHEQNPGIFFHFYSGDTNDIAEKLDKGLIDFGILIEPADLSKYEFVRLPQSDVWGVLMRKDSVLAQKSVITSADLYNEPILRSRHSLLSSATSNWFGQDLAKMNVVASYNLIYNASLLVEAGLGSAITLDKLIKTDGDSPLCFRPLSPRLESHLAFSWKKYQVFSKATQLFLSTLQSKLK